MKIRSLLMALTESAIAGMHGYNSCYIATNPVGTPYDLLASAFVSRPGEFPKC
jgi:hypothetical protein